MTYGRVRFGLWGEGAVAALTPDGWRLESPDGSAAPAIEAMLGVIADPSEFGPADGDPMAAAIMKAAKALNGTYELADLPSPPPGTVY